MKYLCNCKYYVYQVCAKLARRYAFKDRHKSIPRRVCEICGKPGHSERLCPNAARMGFLDQGNERGQ